MLLLPTTSLKVGMTLAQPILHPLCESCVLLTDGVTLEPSYIQRLNELGVSHVWIDFPGLDEVDAALNKEISQDHLRLYQAINDSIERLERRVAVKLNLHQYRKAVRCMLTNIVEEPNHDVITHQLASCGSVLTGHLANCSYLSLLVGAHMTGYLRRQRSSLPADIAENTSELGVGALLHDVGKLLMPDELQNKSILDEQADWPEYRCHVHAGFDHAHENVSVVAANIILNHHQRYDGSGFPPREGRESRPAAPLSGRQIHIFSRIVAVVDAFDHLLCPGGRVVPTIVAIAGLRSAKFAGWFDPVVVETLLRLVPAFQVGSVVTLSNGLEAVVIGNHPEAPCRPTVRLLKGKVGEDGSRTTPRELDLRMCRNITIAAVSGIDVRKYVSAGELEPV